MNSWMMQGNNSEKEDKNAAALRRSMRSTASKLGRKLIAMDKESEVRKKAEKEEEEERTQPRDIKKNSTTSKTSGRNTQMQWRRF